MKSPQHTDTTLVIPAYNRGHLIAETLQSALNQTTPFFQIIVVDDGSTDNTAEVVKSFGQRVTLIQTHNRGVQEARNTGISSSLTAQVALCDSDDLLKPTFLETIGNWLFQHSNVDIVYTNFHTFNSQGQDPDKLSKAPFDFLAGGQLDGCFAFAIPEIYRRSIAYQPLFCSGVVFNKGFFEKIGKFNPAFKGVGSEDWEFTLRAISTGKAAICTQPLVSVRKHQGNDSADSLKMNLGEADILIHSLSHHTEAKKWKADIEKSISSRLLNAFDLAYAKGDFQTARKISESKYKPTLTIKYLTKLIITKLPNAIRTKIWRASIK